MNTDMKDLVISDIQESLDTLYDSPDPWEYYSNPDDSRRVEELKKVITGIKPKNVIDIGCGNGFITQHLPGERVVGVDISRKAIKYAASKVPHASFYSAPLQQCRDLFRGEKFDMICITGVLYDKWIGTEHDDVINTILCLSHPASTLVLCHIDEWYNIKLPFSLLKQKKYKYREYTHVLEVWSVDSLR